MSDAVSCERVPFHLFNLTAAAQVGRHSLPQLHIRPILAGRATFFLILSEQNSHPCSSACLLFPRSPFLFKYPPLLPPFPSNSLSLRLPPPFSRISHGYPNKMRLDTLPLTFSLALLLSIDYARAAPSPPDQLQQRSASSRSLHIPITRRAATQRSEEELGIWAKQQKELLEGKYGRPSAPNTKRSTGYNMYAPTHVISTHSPLTRTPTPGLSIRTLTPGMSDHMRNNHRHFADKWPTL